MEASGRALHGLRVLELSRGVAGAVAGMLLADLGADVLLASTAARDLEREPGFVCWDRNKRVAPLDLDDASDLAELRRLEGVADVVLLDWAPSALSHHRLDATSVHRRNPHLVHVLLPPYGDAQLWSELDPSASALAALCGLADNYSASEDRPVIPVVPVLTYEQGALAATMAVAGVLRAHATGDGQAISVAGLDSVAAMHAAIFVDVPGIVRPAKPLGVPGLPHFRHYECADGEWIFLAALAQPFFLRALEVMDLMDVMVLPEVEGEWLNLQLPDRNPVVHRRLEERFAQRPRHEWLEVLVGADVPCAPVSTRDDWFASETVAENGLRCQVDGGKLGPVELPGVAVVLSGAMYDVRRLAEPVALRDAWAGVEPRALTREVDESHADAGARPLAGLRVLDLASFVAGTFGPSILASLGADVVKVETSVGDPYRDFLAAFAAYNQRKRCLGLDVKHPEGHRVLMDLVGKADVLVDGVRPSVRGRLGIDDASLRAVNPRIIRCSVTGWGDEGPLAETPAFDPLLQARSGLMAAQGGDSMPVYVAMLVHDVGAGTLAALGILAALYQRRSTGAGQEVKVSLASSSVLFQSGELTHFEGRTPPDVGGRDWPGPRAVERLYECADGWLLLDARTELSRRALADAVGGSWPDPASAPSDGPFADAVAALLAPLTTEAALDRMLVAGVPAVPVLPRHAVYTDGWLAEHGVFHTFEQPGLGPCTAVAGYARWRDHDVSYDGPAPRNGEHTRSLLAEAGLDDAEVEALISSGAAHVLESPPAR